MDLLSVADLAEIREAIHDVTDTFAKTPVVLHVKIDNSDRMGRTVGTYADYNVLAFVEYGQKESDITFTTVDGGTIRADIRCLLNLDDMDDAGLIDSNHKPIINPATDNMTCDGVEYKIDLCEVDGGIERRNLICMIFANRRPTHT